MSWIIFVLHASEGEAVVRANWLDMIDPTMLISDAIPAVGGVEENNSVAGVAS